MPRIFEELKLQSGLRLQHSSAELAAYPNGLSRRMSSSYITDFQITLRRLMQTTIVLKRCQSFLNNAYYAHLAEVQLDLPN